MRRIAMLAVLAVTLAACADVTVETFTYDPRTPGHELDVHAPAGATAAPAVLIVHGGSWERGDRDQMSAVADRLARLGYVAATIDYRLVPTGAFPAAAQDVACALAYLRDHADELGVDPARVAAAGYSAGGHLVGLIGVAADVDVMQDGGCPSGRTGAPAAVISYSGPMDLTGLRGEVTEAFVGAAYEDDRARWEQASPRFHIDGDEPPFLFVHPEHDLWVPVAQSEDMAGALRALGNPVSMVRLEGGGHALGDGPGLGVEEWEPPFYTVESWMALADFLATTIGAP